MIEKLKYKDRNEWLGIRNKYVGGSDAGAVMGMNPYKGPYALWLEKTGQSDGFAGNISTETGTLLEPYVAELFTRETGKHVRRDNHTMVNSDYPWACANVDRRIVGENAILECKTTSSLENMKLFKNSEYPATWYCQMTHYLAVTGAKRAYLAVLIGNRDFKWYTLERDESEIAALMEAEKAFWQHVTDMTPPEAMANDLSAVSDSFGPETVTPDVAIDFTPDIDLLQEYAEAEADYKQAEDRRDALKARICERLGTCTEGRADGYKIKWAPVGRSALDVKAFKTAHPDLDYSHYMKTTVSRRFEFSRVK